MADSLGIDRGRLNDLILGRARPRIGEINALSGKRNATLVRYKDTRGNWHGLYTGRQMSFEDMALGGEISSIIDDFSDAAKYDPIGPDGIQTLEPRKNPNMVNVSIIPYQRGAMRNRMLRNKYG